MSKTFLCVSCYFKGADFIIAAKEAGNSVFLVTSKKLEDKPWPKDFIDEIFYMEEDEEGQWNMKHLVSGLAHVMRTRFIDRIIALDDFDVEKAAHLREHFRIPGMGETTARHFRDKLGMRMKAQDEGLRVPPFAGLFNDEQINHFANTVAAPWVVKPRAEASATGIKKVHNIQELWEVIHSLGEHRHQYLVEQFKPGDVYHVDGLSKDGKVIFSRVSQYLNPPFDVAHGGGIFQTHIVEFGSADDKALQKFNKEVMKAFGMQYSAFHSEYIKSKEDGQFYFLETASRVGGAHIAEMVEASSGINLWKEWAKLETAIANNKPYKLPKINKDYAGLVVSLSRYKDPDMSSFQEAEIWWKMKEDYHIGLITVSKKRERILELLEHYAHRIFNEFHASAPAPDKSVH